MPYFSTTMSSVGTTPAANLNWIGGKPTTVVITGSSSGTSDFTLQYTLTDSQLSTTQTWIGYGLSSAVGTPPLTPFHFNSSLIFPSGVGINFLGPIAGLRLSSTTLGAGTVTMQVTQGEGW